MEVKKQFIACQGEMYMFDLRITKIKSRKSAKRITVGFTIAWCLFLWANSAIFGIVLQFGLGLHIKLTIEKIDAVIWISLMGCNEKFNICACLQAFFE